eukprot:7233622-Alexandrium_andersonii.AAC.1
MKSAAAFFDFKAAFPSVSRDFMWAVLECVGLPRNWIRLLPADLLGQQAVHWAQAGRVLRYQGGHTAGVPLVAVALRGGSRL